MKNSSATATADASNSTVEDLKALIHDAEQALEKGSDLTDEKLEELRERLRSAVDQGRTFYHRACDSARRGAAQADQVVRSHPYESIGIALGAGVLLGYFISRR